MSKSEVIETITPQEVQAVNNAKQRVALANSEAEKAVALLRLAESEAKNLVFQIYNKYDLKIGQDQVLESGNIVRQPELTKEVTEQLQNEADLSNETITE